MLADSKFDFACLFFFFCIFMPLGCLINIHVRELIISSISQTRTHLSGKNHYWLDIWTGNAHLFC